ncbi:MAG: hypothetical protein ACKOC4_02190 [Planctomycetia bacterium]
MSDEPYIVVVLAPVLGLGVYCVTHIVLARLRWGRSPYGPLITGFLVGFIATIAIALQASSRLASGGADGVALTGLDCLIYAALAWCYFHFVNLGIASLRIRVLEEIAEAGGSLEARALRELYDDAQMAEARVERLLAGGHIVFRDERFHTGRHSFLAVARIFAILRGLILGADSA